MSKGHGQKVSTWTFIVAYCAPLTYLKKKKKLVGAIHHGVQYAVCSIVFHSCHSH